MERLKLLGDQTDIERKNGIQALQQDTHNNSLLLFITEKPFISPLKQK